MKSLPSTIFRVSNVNGTGWLFAPEWPEDGLMTESDQMSQLQHFCAEKEAKGCIITSVVAISAHERATPRVKFRDKAYRKLVEQILEDSKNMMHDPANSANTLVAPCDQSKLAEWTWIMSFIQEQEGCYEPVVRQQYRALWTSFCLRHKLDVDTAEYDQRIQNMFQAIKDTLSPDVPFRFEAFDLFMGEHLS